jgi:SAM-dependent methyltransferase
LLRDPEGKESQSIRDLLGPSAGHVLEVGCGDGRLTGELASFSDSILGLEPDPASIDKARHLLGNGIMLMQGSGEQIPLADGTVDTVVFSLSLHHHPDPNKALLEAWRVLKEQGRILVLEPGSESPINRCFRIIHNEDEVYENAAAAVDICRAELAGSGSFISTWRFDDFEEMVEHLHSYFELETEEAQVRAMENILGSRARNCPLEVEDTTRWWLLTKSSSA